MGQGRTALLSSHILAEAEVLCDRVSIIRRGKIVETGTLDQMRHLTRTSVHVHTTRPITGLQGRTGVYDLETDADGAAFEVDGHLLGDLITHLAGFGILMLTCTPPTLEDLFLRHYGDELASLSKNGNGGRS